VFVSETRRQIAALRREGLNTVEIARALGVSTNTVDYHLARNAELTTAPDQDHASDEPSPDSARRPTTRQQVRDLLLEGLPRAEVARRLGVSKSTVTYHARGLDQPIDERCARRYDWAVIQAYYDLGHSVRQCRDRFGFSLASWQDAVRRGEIVPRPLTMPIDQLLQNGVRRNRRHVKMRLLNAGLVENHCARCGIHDWRGAPLSLSLHHMNGERDDNRLENLELLCPNCHSQTPNFSGRNGRRRMRSDAEAA
jgi:DNA-binding CsgD family transcriptional regulator